jgi:hypothetical protein
MKLLFPIITFCMFVTSPLLAQSIPTQLQNKTIHISATFSTPIMGRSGPTIASKISTSTIYVSTLGRIFVRSDQRANNGTTSASEKSPRETGWRFSGGKLVNRFSTVSGAATLLEVSFDGSFQNCEYSGIMGHVSGKSYSWKGLNGKRYEATGQGTMSGASCSVTAGNGL